MGKLTDALGSGKVLNFAHKHDVREIRIETIAGNTTFEEQILYMVVEIKGRKYWEEMARGPGVEDISFLEQRAREEYRKRYTP
ncbi:MAG: hypothetical protein Q7S56_00380 [Nanoarchaeota archaeon]|nr:hypothetical protein [Nanoarchaeota archaeon]